MFLFEIKKMKKLIIWMFCFLCLSFADSFSRFTLEIENDLFVGTDHGYTHGTKFNLAKYDVDDVSNFNIKQHSFFQFIYTPTEIDVVEPQLNDRPWAGLAAYEYSKYFQSYSSFKFSGFQLGVIGPWALAEYSQKIAHQLTNSTTPLGWDNQLDNMLVVGSYGGLGYFYYKTDRFQVSQNAGYYVGTHLSNISSTVVARYGSGLNSQHSFISMDPYTRSLDRIDKYNDRFLWNFYVGGEYRYVFYNELITGNENNITLDNSVYDVFSGIGISRQKWSINYQYVLRGKEFQEDRNFNGFGRVVLGYNF
jgi:lipid A 3-O-deacylase